MNRPKKQNPSTYDIARQAGVSQTTVSFVLNERADMPISAATRERVLSAARELGYRRNSLARSLVRGRTQTVGVVVPRLDSTFSAHIAQGIQEACDEHDLRVLLAHTRHRPEVEARQVDLLLEHRVDGLICVMDEQTIEQTTDWLDALVAREIPCVLVDDRTYADRADCVVSDDEGGASRVVEHLLSRGHRRIAHLSAGRRVSSGRDRESAYRIALTGAGIDPEAFLVVGSGFETENWRVRVNALLSVPNPPTAIFAANDYIAALALEVMEERGLLGGRDIAVAGYADYPLGRFLHLTTVDQNPQGMGRAAAERLLRRIAEPGLAPDVTVLPTRLVVRKSTALSR